MQMLYDFIEYEQRLAQHHVRSMAAGFGDGIYCHEGQLWITDGSGEDIVLSAGQSHLIRRGGRIVIEALAAARLQFLPAGGGAPTMKSARDIAQQWRAVIHRLGQRLIAFYVRRSHLHGACATTGAGCCH